METLFGTKQRHHTSAQRTAQLGSAEIKPFIAPTTQRQTQCDDVGRRRPQATELSLSLPLEDEQILPTTSSGWIATHSRALPNKQYDTTQSFNLASRRSIFALQYSTGGLAKLHSRIHQRGPSRLSLASSATSGGWCACDPCEVLSFPLSLFSLISCRVAANSPRCNTRGSDRTQWTNITQYTWRRVHAHSRDQFSHSLPSGARGRPTSLDAVRSPQAGKRSRRARKVASSHM
jgi:hypothetical protein